jgi:predicted transcriptional regulator
LTTGTAPGADAEQVSPDPADLNGFAGQPADLTGRQALGRLSGVSKLPATPGKRSRSNPIPPHEVQILCRELAMAEVSQNELARRHGVTKSAVSQFARRHAARIAEIREHLDDQFAGLWIADKANRLAVYQHEVEAIAGNTHHEWVKAKATLLKNVAEETGQLPPRATAVIVPVVHIIEAGGEIDVKADLT